MVKARTWLSLFILGLGTIAATASCGGSDEGTSSSSAGSGGGGLVTAGGSSRAGSTGRAGSSGSSAGAGNVGDGSLGAPCETDDQCTGGTKCFTADSTSFADAGIAHGMCNIDCKQTADCDALQTGADCFNFGTQAAPVLHCLAACTLGTPADADLQNKCSGRPDFLCQDFADATAVDPDPFCVPRCRGDFDCGTGLFCDKLYGLCSAMKYPGDPLGTPCTPGAATQTCEGVCLQTSDTGVTPVTGVCSEICSGLLGCAYDGDKPTGLCMGPLTNPFGLLDRGYCLPTCDCTSECPYPDDLCRKWGTTANEQSIAMDYEKAGLCFPNVSGSVELSCGEGGAGGAPGIGEAGAGGALP